MNDLNIAQLLLNIGKNDKQLLGLLDYIYNNKKEDQKSFTTDDLSKFTGVNKDSIVTSLNNLKNKNICGVLLYETSLTERKLIKEFSSSFKKAMGDTTKKCVIKSGFYIIEGDSIFVYNPCILTWRYPTWKKIAKQVNHMRKILSSPLVSYIHKNKNNPEIMLGDDFIGGWKIKEVFNTFLDKYKLKYDSYYNVEWSKDYGIFKNILVFLDKNNVPENMLNKFFEFSFRRAKVKGFRINLGNLQYSANEFVIEFKKFKNNGQFEYDVDGRLRKANT